MKRFTTLAVLPLAGCGWNAHEATEAPWTIPSSQREKPHAVVEADASGSIALDSGVQAGLYGLVNDTCMFMVRTGHGLEVSDTIDAHWPGTGKVRSGMIVISATGYTIEAAGGSGPVAAPPAQAVLTVSGK